MVVALVVHAIWGATDSADRVLTVLLALGLSSPLCVTVLLMLRPRPIVRRLIAVALAAGVLGFGLLGATGVLLGLAGPRLW